MTKAETTLGISKTINKKTTDMQKVIEEKLMQEPYGKIEVGFHRTVNTGNFESIKLSLNLSRPVPAEVSNDPNMARAEFISTADFLTDLSDRMINDILRPQSRTTGDLENKI